MSRWFDGSSSSIRSGSASSSLASISRFCSPPLSDSTASAKALAAKAEPVQHPLDLVVEVVGVVAVELLLEVVVAGGQAAVLGRRRVGCGQRVGHLQRLVLKRDQLRQRRCGLRPRACGPAPTRAAVRGSRRGPTGAARTSRRRLVLAGEDPQQRRLAAAVGPDQPDPLAGADLERDPASTGSGPKCLRTLSTLRTITRNTVEQ